MNKHLGSSSTGTTAIVFAMTLMAFAGLQAQTAAPPSSAAARPEESSSGVSVDGLDGLIGSWDLAGESPYGPMRHTLVVNADGKATYESSGEISEVRDLEIDGNQVRFEMTVFGGPTSYEVAFEGRFDEDGLSGDMLTGDGAEFAPLSAPRAPDLSELIGTWNLSGESPYGPMQHRLVVAADGKATYESQGEVSEVTSLEVDGNQVRFDMTVFGGPNSYELSFAGTFDAEGLTGDILNSAGSFATLTAPRE